MQVVVQNILTTYEQIGEGTENLLILPGWGRSLKEWRPVAQKLSTVYTVTLLDLPGFGGTALPKKEWDIYAYATFVQEFIEKTKLHSCVVLGHSFGGRIGIILAAQSTFVKKLVLVDTGGIEEKSGDVRLRAAIAGLLKPFLSSKAREGLRNRFGSADYREAGALQEVFVRVVNQDLRALLPKITIPTLIIWGEQDSVVPLRYSKLIKELLPAAKVRVVWEAGHDPHLEKPEEFMTILKEYLW